MFDAHAIESSNRFTVFDAAAPFTSAHVCTYPTDRNTALKLVIYCLYNNYV